MTAVLEAPTFVKPKHGASGAAGTIKALREAMSVAMADSGEEAEEKLRRGACVDCGRMVRITMVKIKSYEILGRAAHLPAEMAKCDLRCAYCTRLMALREKRFGRPPRIFADQA